MRGLKGGKPYHFGYAVASPADAWIKGGNQPPIYTRSQSHLPWDAWIKDGGTPKTSGSTMSHPSWDAWIKGVMDTSYSRYRKGRISRGMYGEYNI